MQTNNRSPYTLLVESALTTTPTMSGTSYNEYLHIFNFSSSPVEASSLNKNSAFVTLVLLLIGM